MWKSLDKVLCVEIIR